MQNRSGAGSLVFGGLMAALTVVIVYLVPFPMFFPVPLVLVYIRYGLRPVLTAGAAVALLVTALMGWVQALLIVPLVVLPALSMGYGVTQKLSPLLTIAATSVTAFAARLLNLGLTFLVLGQNPIELMIEAQVTSTELARELFQKFAPASDPRTAQMLEAMELTVELMPTMLTLLLPAILLLGAVAAAMLTYSVCRWILPRFGHPIAPVTPFKEWVAPPWLNGAFVAGLALILLGMVSGPALDWIRRLGINVVFALSFVYMSIGAAVAYHWLLSRVTKGVAIALLVLAFLMLSAYALLGLLFVGMWDALFDFRKLRTQTQGGKQP